MEDSGRLWGTGKTLVLCSSPLNVAQPLWPGLGGGDQMSQKRGVPPYTATPATVPAGQPCVSKPESFLSRDT